MPSPGFRFPDHTVHAFDGTFRPRASHAPRPGSTPLIALTREFESRGWRRGTEDTAVSVNGDRVRIVTDRSHYSYQLVSSAFDTVPRADYVLSYDAETLTGAATVGVLDETAGSWIAQTNLMPGRSTGHLHFVAPGTPRPDGDRELQRRGEGGVLCRNRHARRVGGGTGHDRGHRMTLPRDQDICIVGGAGHVGLPLALVFAAAGQRVIVHDVNAAVMDTVKGGTMPFIEYGAGPLLASALESGRLTFSSAARDIARASHVIVAVGTPVDEYLNPKLRALLDLFTSIRPHLDPAQTIIIRSTVFPRTCRHVLRLLAKDGRDWRVAYCPERIAQGYAIRELNELPQIVSGCSEDAVDSASRLFALIAPQIIRLEVEEAELAKLFTNAWRYIQFAAANQFYMIAESVGVDFNQVRQAMVDGYGRAASLPSAGFAAGPCLLKDTMQLAAFNANAFTRLATPRWGSNWAKGCPAFSSRASSGDTSSTRRRSAFSAWRSRPTSTTSATRFPTSSEKCCDSMVPTSITPTSSHKIRPSLPRNSWSRATTSSSSAFRTGRIAQLDGPRAGRCRGSVGSHPERSCVAGWSLSCCSSSSSCASFSTGCNRSGSSGDGCSGVSSAWRLARKFV